MSFYAKMLQKAMLLKICIKLIIFALAILSPKYYANNL